MVYKQAKTSLSLEPTSFKIPFSNFKPSINKYILEEWQTSWNNSIGNKLLDIKPTIGEYQSIDRNIRKEKVILARLRLGRKRVSHSYLLQGEEQPQCVSCDASFTARHFLLECGNFAQVRNNCFHVDSIKELFQDIHIDSIMTFLRQINLFNKIYLLFLKSCFVLHLYQTIIRIFLMLYSVQLKNMYSYLNSSLKLSDIVRGLSCQHSYCN